MLSFIFTTVNLIMKIDSFLIVTETHLEADRISTIKLLAVNYFHKKAPL